MPNFTRFPLPPDQEMPMRVTNEKIAKLVTDKPAGDIQSRHLAGRSQQGTNGHSVGPRRFPDRISRARQVALRTDVWRRPSGLRGCSYHA
jgi:hypothetical protein